MVKERTTKRPLLWCKLKHTLMPLVASFISNTWSKSQRVKTKNHIINSNKQSQVAWCMVPTALLPITQEAWWECLLLHSDSHTSEDSTTSTLLSMLQRRKQHKYLSTIKLPLEVQLARKKRRLLRRSGKSSNTPILWKRTHQGTEKSYLKMMTSFITLQGTKIERGERHVSRPLS